MSDDAPKPPSAVDLLSVLIDEIRGLRADMRLRGGLPDLKIGKPPKNWNGPSYEGRTASDCPSDFLLEYAAYQEWRADTSRAEGKLKYVASNEREAAICRRWATANKNVRPPEKQGGWATPKQDDAPPDTQNSRREGEQPATATRPKWGASSGGWGNKKASGQ